LKIRTLILWLSVIPGVVNGQKNLVPNGDFETHTDKSFPCSWLIDEANINNYLYDWYTPIATTTDILSTYADEDCWAHTPETGEGYMQPHSGNVMVGFINYSPDGGCQPSEWHEYLSVELNQTLTPGNMYCLEFWVALGANSFYATNNIGALFTTKSPESTNCSPILQKPQINVSTVIKNTTTWLRVEAGFIADSNYRYLTIGNFYSHDSTIIMEQMKQPAQQPQGTPMPESDTDNNNIAANDISYLAYYFIDDVRLYLCPSVQNRPTPAQEENTAPSN
jgi:hypothetical protein